jgi:hypothetical protein
MDQPGGLEGRENIFVQAWRQKATFDLSEDSVLKAGVIQRKGTEKVTDGRALQKYHNRMAEKKKMVGEHAADARKSEGAGCAELR